MTSEPKPTQEMTAIMDDYESLDAAARWMDGSLAAPVTQSYPRCAECGLTDDIEPNENCPRCGENAVVRSPLEHAQYDNMRRVEQHGV